MQINFKPQARILIGPKGDKIVSFRWLGSGFDYFKLGGLKLLQYGNKTPVHFICTIIKKQRPPTFLFSIHWTVHRSFMSYKAGITTKPLKIDTIWRSLCHNDLDHCNHGTSMKKNPPCSIMLTTAAKD